MLKNDIEIIEIDIERLQKGYANREFSIQEITKIYLDRINELDFNGPKLNSIIQVNPDALKIAMELDNELSNGKRSRVSAEEYNTKKQKFLSKQGGGADLGQKEEEERKQMEKHERRVEERLNKLTPEQIKQEEEKKRLKLKSDSNRIKELIEEFETNNFGSYEVGDTQATTINNKKTLEELLVKKISKNIINQIVLSK